LFSLFFPRFSITWPSRWVLPFPLFPPFRQYRARFFLSFPPPPLDETLCARPFIPPDDCPAHGVSFVPDVDFIFFSLKTVPSFGGKGASLFFLKQGRTFFEYLLFFSYFPPTLPNTGTGATKPSPSLPSPHCPGGFRTC